MSVFNIIKNQMIELERETKEKEKSLELAFNNGASIKIENKYFVEACSRVNHTWEYTLKCLIASDFNYSMSK